MAVTREKKPSLPPPPSQLVPNIDPESDEFAARLWRFSWARALVFSGAGASVAAIFAKNIALSDFGYSVRATVGVVVLAWFSAGLQAWASRSRFQMYVVALALLVLDQALCAALAYLAGGVSSAATSLLGVTCLVGGFLLGVPGAVAAGFAGGIFFSLIFLITQGAPDLLPPDQPRSLYQLTGAQAAYYYVFTMLMLVLVSLLSSVLADRLTRTGGALREAQARAQRAERMAALGRLAAGLAHEIRNPLSAISGAVQMLRTEVEREDDRDLCDIVLRESGRLNDLVSDMLNLSKPQAPLRVTMDLGNVIADVVELAASSGRGAGDVHITRQGRPRAFLYADPSRIRQLVWNLVRNAIQASAAGGEVRVRLEVSDTVELYVEDDGRGMDCTAQEHIFDAFFTTRSQGTGLGLAVVKRIADDHGYAVEVHSEQNEGAQFVVRFGKEHAAPVT